MDPKAFQTIPAGRLIRTAQGYHAFVPSAQAPSFHYSPALVLCLSRADAALSELSGLIGHLPNPDLIITPYVRREALLSSRIEGTQASLKDVMLEEARGDPPDPSNREVREVVNYGAALYRGMEELKSLPLSLRLVKNVHRALFAGLGTPHVTPGEFRRTQNWIGPPGGTLSTAAFVPPPVPEMHAALDRWEKFLHRRDDYPDLVKCALMHEQFETIHPFVDGNGRIGRLLITLFLIERGRLRAPVLYLSEYIESHRSDYYTRLQRVRTHGDWNGWLAFFLQATAETAGHAVRQAQALTDLRAVWREKLAKAPRAAALLDRLFANPYVSTSAAAAVLGVSLPTARSTIAVLEKAGLLRETTRRNWGRMWLAVPILEALESPLVAPKGATPKRTRKKRN
jgi:Fic family protein